MTRPAESAEVREAMEPARVKSGAGGNALPVPNRSKSSCLQRLAIHDRTRFRIPAG